MVGTLWVSPVVVPDPAAGQLDAESLRVMVTWVLILIGPIRILARSSAVKDNPPLAGMPAKKRLARFQLAVGFNAQCNDQIVVQRGVETHILNH